MKKIIYIIGAIAVLVIIFLIIKYSAVKTYFVNFDSDGGTEIRQQEVEKGKCAVEPKEPTKDGYEFICWLYNNSEFDFSTSIVQNITLKAKWQEVKPHIHIYDKEVVLPTCENKGYTLYICECGDMYKDDYNSLGHDLVERPKVEPTCTEIGCEKYVECTRCSFSTYKELPALGHDLVKRSKVEPTCTEIGCEEYVECTRCSFSTYKELPALGHDLVEYSGKDATNLDIGWKPYVDCKRCDYSTYEELPALSTEKIDLEIFFENGYKYIKYGSYPQTHVNDEELIDNLNSLTQTNDRGYYEFEGEEYSKIENVTPYKYGSYSKTDENGQTTIKYYRYSSGAVIKENRTEWFKVEPIKWRILSTKEGEHLVLSEYILDRKQYYKDTNYRQINGVNIAPNNYKYSDIREFLNNEFLNSAFTNTQQELLITTEVDNSWSSTNYLSNKYACENTYDKIFLLSYKDVCCINYGFSSFKLRGAKVTDYVKASGSLWIDENDHEGDYLDMGYWLLRSPYYNEYSNSYDVCYNGHITVHNVVSTPKGVRPAMVIKAK